MLIILFIIHILYYARTEPLLNIINLSDNPIVQIKEMDCKIQTGTIRIIHPVNLASIEQSIELITNKFYQNSNTNPLREVIRFRIKKLYSTLYGLKPQPTRRHRRWDSIGTAWKWIAGSPDAHDLRIINTTLNELITQNNQQYRVNNNINDRITQLTATINKVVQNINSNKAELDILETMTTMLNINVVNELLDNIQETITLTRMSVANSKMLSTREITNIKSTLEEQGVNFNYPDEALQFVDAKVAVRDEDLLYILHVPRLEDQTSTIVRIYPLIVKDQIVSSHPSHVIRHGSKLYTKPKDFVQRFSDVKEFHDNCIRPIILGKRSRCYSIFANTTTQQLVSENTIIISNAINHTLESNCGPDNRSLTGNYVIKFADCTIRFNNQTFQSSEILVDTAVMPGAFHNALIEWNLTKQHNIAEISDTVMKNRMKLDHVHLQQNQWNFKLWSSFGGFSITTISCVVAVIVFAKVITCRARRSEPPGTDPGRLGVKEGGVNAEPAWVPPSREPTVAPTPAPAPRDAASAAPAPAPPDAASAATTRPAPQRAAAVGSGVAQESSGRIANVAILIRDQARRVGNC